LDLAAAVPIVANWSMSSIPRAIAADQVRQLLASIDRRTAIGVVTTLSCSCSHDWACVQVRWCLSSSIISTGTRESSAFAARVVSAASYHCPRKLAKRSPRICSMDGRKVPVGAYFYAPKLPSAVFEVPAALDRLFGIVSCAPALMLPFTEHISFAMDWPPSCCVRARRSVRSVSCWVTAVPRPPRFTPKWSSVARVPG
jgi:hypothetical protein